MLYDSYGKSYELGDEIGCGREGSVYRIVGEPLVAKIYHNPTPQIARSSRWRRYYGCSLSVKSSCFLSLPGRSGGSTSAPTVLDLRAIKCLLPKGAFRRRRVAISAQPRGARYDRAAKNRDAHRAVQSRLGAP